MSQSVTIEIINEGAMNLLRDMEYLRLIRLSKREPVKEETYLKKYKGAMTKQSVSSIDEQLKELRDAWE